jgi:hypothetical protein
MGEVINGKSGKWVKWLVAELANGRSSTWVKWQMGEVVVGELANEQSDCKPFKWYLKVAGVVHPKPFNGTQFHGAVCRKKMCLLCLPLQTVNAIPRRCLTWLSKQLTSIEQIVSLR